MIHVFMWIMNCSHLCRLPILYSATVQYRSFVSFCSCCSLLMFIFCIVINPSIEFQSFSYLLFFFCCSMNIIRKWFKIKPFPRHSCDVLCCGVVQNNNCMRSTEFNHTASAGFQNWNISIQKEKVVLLFPYLLVFIAFIVAQSPDMASFSAFFSFVIVTQLYNFKLRIKTSLLVCVSNPWELYYWVGSSFLV